MISSFRRIHAWATTVAFVATLAFSLTASGHFDRDDDTGCGQVALVTGHPITQFQNTKSPATSAHCPLCHWQRAVGGASVAPTASVVAELQALSLPFAPRDLAGGSSAVEERPSRAPPA